MYNLNRRWHHRWFPWLQDNEWTFVNSYLTEDEAVQASLTEQERVGIIYDYKITKD